MIVGGMPGLFPLEKLNSTWQDYYINAVGHVFSTKLGAAPRKLQGSTSASGQYYKLTGGGVGSSHILRKELLAWDILRRATQHKDFKNETSTVIDTQPHEIVTLTLTEYDADVTGFIMTDKNFDSFNKLKGTPHGRSHAKSLAEGIKERGYIIGQVQKEALVFGSQPQVHTTLQSVKSEIERLAGKTPGLQLVYLKIEGSVRAAAMVWE